MARADTPDDSKRCLARRAVIERGQCEAGAGAGDQVGRRQQPRQAGRESPGRRAYAAAVPSSRPKELLPGVGAVLLSAAVTVL